MSQRGHVKGAGGKKVHLPIVVIPRNVLSKGAHSRRSQGDIFEGFALHHLHREFRLGLCSKLGWLRRAS